MADADSKRCSKCGATKPILDFYKQGRAAYCIPCEKQYKREHYLANADRIKAKSAQWNAENPERKSETNKEWRKVNHERCLANARQWVERNQAKRKDIYTKSRLTNIESYRDREARYREQNREQCNKRTSFWKRLNKEKLTFYFHRRRAATLQAMPSWANEDAIFEVFKRAQELTAETGVLHHVDHIVPLLSGLVCGLHCEANLRVIPASENLKKNNRYWPDMP